MNQDIFYQDKNKCKTPFTHIEDSIPDSLKIIDELYGAADVLSINNEVKHQNILLLLSIVGTVIAISLLLYDEAELHGLILSCIVMIVLLFVIHKISDNLDCHKKYLEYRVLAETLRLQYFLAIAGINQQVNNLFPWYIKKSIPWIDDIFNSLPQIVVNTNNSVLDCWIRSQKYYHEIALTRAERKKYRNDRIKNMVIVITIVSYVFGVLFELMVYMDYMLGVDVNFIRTIIKIILGTMSAITLFISSYYGKMSLENIIDDHKRMILLYQQAEDDILKHGESEELLLFLAREFLIENSTWYAYQNKNSADIVL